MNSRKRMRIHAMSGEHHTDFGDRLCKVLLLTQIDIKLIALNHSEYFWKGVLLYIRLTIKNLIGREHSINSQ